MTDEKIKFSIADGIARIVLDDPDNHNAVGSRMTRELASAAIACEAEPGLRAVLLTATGEQFSVGGDLNEFLRERDHIRDHIREMATYFHLAITVLNRLEAPVVAAINGIAAGGGFSLACMSDLAIAKRSAKFNLAYTRSGLTPDGGSSWFLPRLVGAQKAFDIMATNPTLSAEKACELGLIARVVDDDRFEEEVEAILQTVANSPSNAVGRAKRLLRASLCNSLEQQLELESYSVASIASSPETLKTLEAFFEQRKK